MLYVQDRMNKTLAVIDNYYNDEHTMILESGVSTYNFTISKNQEGAEYLIRGNYIVLTDEKGIGWKFTIMATDETHGTLDVECEDLGLELLNKVRNSWASPGAAQPFKYYFDKALRDTGWTLGINEISGLSRTLQWDGRDTALKRLLSICTQFDHAEIEFKIEFRNMSVVKQVVNVYKKRGVERSDVQLVYGDTVNDVRKTTEIRELATAIQGVGGVIQKDNPVEGEPEEHVDFTSLAYDDGEYFTPAGDPFLYARIANKQFNIRDTYLEDFYDYDTQDTQELLNRTLMQLKDRCQPKINYEVDLAKVDSSLNLGDTVTIIDHDYKPELLLSGRVLQLDKSYTDPSKNKATFGNFLILYSNISDQLRALQDQMNSFKPVANYMWIRYAEDDKGKGMTAMPTADTKYFAMLVNKRTGVPSDNPSDYAGHWKLIQGADGIPGTPGADGRTPHLHTAWANSFDGKNGFSTDMSTNKSYMGTYVNFTEADPTDPALYNWIELVGALVIGGRNYLADTDTPWQAQGSGGGNQSSSGKWQFTFGTIKQAPFNDGDYVTLSFDYINVGTGAYGVILPQFNNTPWGIFGDNTAMKDNGHVVRTVQWKSDWTTSGTATGIQIRMDDVATTRTVTVYNMQFERGNKATDHKAAPEDAQEQIDTINQGLVDTNGKINAVNKIDRQATAPTNPKKGDQWWVLSEDPTTGKDAIEAFKQWDGTQWTDAPIQQSAMNIGTLNGNIINGATINGSEFTNNFDYTGPDKIHYKGVTEIKDGAVDSAWKIPENNQTGYSRMNASGFETVVNNPDGTIIKRARLGMGELFLSGDGISGWINEQDSYRNSGIPSYLNNWGVWNQATQVRITRNGRQVTISGYIKHYGGNVSPIVQVPAWAMPENQVEIINGASFDNDVGNSKACNLSLGKDGLLANNAGVQVNGYLSFSASYTGVDIK